MSEPTVQDLVESVDALGKTTSELVERYTEAIFGVEVSAGSAAEDAKKTAADRVQTGLDAEFTALKANEAKDSAAQAEQAKLDAQEVTQLSTFKQYRDQAQQGATTSANKANVATEQATLASNKANVATEQATLASNKANVATEQATLASNKANVATEQATLASNKANVATEQATLASNKANVATEQATLASNKANVATQEATNSATQAGIATQKAQAASDSERVVLQKAQEVSNNASLVATNTSTVVRKSDEVAANTTVVEEKTAVVIEKASEVANNASTVASAIVAHEEKADAHPNATTTKNGFMSSEDKAKLNGLNITNSINDTTEGRLLKVGDMLARGRCVLFSYTTPAEAGVFTFSTSGVTQYFDIIIIAGWNTHNRSGCAHYRVYNAVAGENPYVQTIVAPKSLGGGNFSAGYKFRAVRLIGGYNQSVTIEVAKPAGSGYHIIVLGSSSHTVGFSGISFDPTRTSADVGNMPNNDTIYHTGNIVGTVSQSGGVPTGAIIQRGSNANGEFVRYADGTQICTKMVNFGTAITTPNGQIFNSPRVTWSYPAGFIDVPAVSGSGVIGVSFGWVMGDFITGTAAASLMLFQGLALTSSTALTVGVSAIGRWY